MTCRWGFLALNLMGLSQPVQEAEDPGSTFRSTALLCVVVLVTL